jgi:cytochrome c oxidase cbb3-type subunit 3
MKRSTDTDELLDHETDGIREFDNALPRWWLYGFYFTIAFAVAYFVNYHVLATPLVGKPTLLAEYQAETAAAVADRHASHGGHADGAGGPVTLLTDPAALAKGQEIFEGPANLCWTCHRKDLGGLIGPNLTDNAWRHGCDPATVMQNVRTGFPVQGMLPYGSAKPLTDDELLQVVSYVFSKHGSNPVNPKAVDPKLDQPCG